MSFRNGKDHGVLYCTGVEFRRADQIADVFQDHEIQRLGSEALKSLGSHACVQMAHAAGVKLDDFGTGLFDGGCINIGIDVGFHDADLEVVFQSRDGAFQGSGLTGSGRAHQVQQENALILQFAAQFVRFLVVVGKYALFYFYDFITFHFFSPQV